MTLDGLRNVHSYDHTWSVERNAGHRCYHGYNPENCMLQASFSSKAHALLEMHGFTDMTADLLRDDWRAYAVHGLANPFFSEREKVEGRLKLWGYEEAEFFKLYDAKELEGAPNAKRLRAVRAVKQVPKWAQF